MLLSPEQFTRLSEYASYSNRKVRDVLPEFQIDGKYYRHLKDDEEGCQTISFEAVKIFMLDYFGEDIPTEIVDQLFLSFSKPAGKPERRTSLFEDALSSVRSRIHGNLHSLAERIEKLALGTHVDMVTRLTDDGSSDNRGIPDLRIPLRPLICTLSLIEADTPENKLEVVFHVYDSDGNGELDKSEMEGIIEQMMNVARYKQWDTTELEQILRQMLADIDLDNDGIVSLEEWRRGGMTNIPLLVLLGLDTFAEMKEDGNHVWRLRHFSKPNYCNACCSILVGWGGKQGLCCSLCKYTVHERCVRSAASNCIKTFTVRTANGEHTLYHHWLDANTTAKCVKCRATVGVFQGKRCRWCRNYVHHRCMSSLPQTCDMGSLAYHILPPTHIFPAFLERKSSSLKNFNPHSHSLLQAVSPGASVRPLLVLVNPKSGGKQGVRILQKFAHILNPRQVYDLSKVGPEPGLNLFSTIANCNVLVCGGDGTVGWVLEAMGLNSAESKLMRLNLIENLQNACPSGMDGRDGRGESGKRKTGIPAFHIPKSRTYYVRKTDRTEFPHGQPPVAVLPLGTGNDLSRCLRWGGGYESENLNKILQQIEKATLIDLDRWQIHIEPNEASRRRGERGDPPPYNIINNYFSIGVDASIAHRFHVMREKFPEKFNSRMRNKLWYFELGTTETLSASCKNLHEQIYILCDGETIDLGQDTSLEGIALLNIPSIYGGSNLWGSSRKLNNRFFFSQLSTDSDQLNTRTQEMGDGLIELVGLGSAMQMGQIKAGVRGAKRLSQCSTIVIQTHKAFPMQIDGEPWMQPPCIIQITHRNQAKMLVAPRKRSSWCLVKRQSTADDL